MLVFIGSLGHPDVANNYGRVQYMLNNTLLSVCNQTDDDFKILIVCNKRPCITEQSYDSFVEYIEVDFPCPQGLSRSDVNMEQLTLEKIRKDKGTKLIVGIAEAQKLKPDYIMFFDTDDFVSSDIAGFVHSSGNGHNGWYIDKGYIHCLDTGLYYEENNFNQKCGTSLIINNELLANPVSRGHVIIHTSAGAQSIDTENTSFLGAINRRSSQQDIMDAVDNNFLNYIIGSHRWAAQYYGLIPLPFRGAIWNINTGENYVDKRTVKVDLSIDPGGIEIKKFIPLCTVVP